MKYTSQLERRVAHLESMMSKNEGKQVGTLYHVWTLQSYLKYILPNDELKASGKYTNQIYGSDEFVSFTRDQFFVVGTKSVQMSKVLVQLVIDGNKLSDHYKIGPYNEFAFDTDGNRVEIPDNPADREKEEAVKGPIKNLSKYIKEILFDGFDIDQWSINMITKANLIEKMAVWYELRYPDSKNEEKAFDKDIINKLNAANVEERFNSIEQIKEHNWIVEGGFENENEYNKCKSALTIELENRKKFIYS